MTSDLATKHCVPCERSTAPMSRADAQALTAGLSGWSLMEGEPKLERKLKFKDFAEAMNFVNAVAEIAESEGHHPDISISWNRVTLELTTHAINGLSENDFIIAAKINELKGSDVRENLVGGGL